MHFGQRRFIVGFLSVPFGLYALFVLWPYLQAFYISLTDWEGFSPTKDFVGLENFAELLGDGTFWTSLTHNLYLLIVLPVVTISIALLFSSLINFGGSGKRTRGEAGIRGVVGSRFYMVVYFFPHVMSIAMVAVLWLFVYEPRNGLLNGFLGLIGLDGLQHPWLGNSTTALGSVMAVSVWGGVGFFVVLFTAAMTSVPHDLYESAMLDGADRIKTFRHLTLPLIRDSVQVAAIYMGINALDTFALINIITVGPGGPAHSTDVIALYLYESAFVDGRFGYSAAIGVALFFITIVLAMAAFRLTQREKIEY